MKRDAFLARPLAARYHEACAVTDQLFDVVDRAHWYDRPIAERHRIIFYIGHLEAFDWNLLAGTLVERRSFDEALDRLFAFGIDPVGGGLPTDVPEDWPSLDRVLAYRDGVRGTIGAALREPASESLVAKSAIDSASQAARDQLMSVAVEHRLMHAETLAYMLHQLPAATKIVPPGLRREAEDRWRSPAQALQPIPAGTAKLGLDREKDRDVFGWDNEYGADVREVPGFSIQRHMVSNGDFLRFIEADGYRDPRWWSEHDWQWVQAAGISKPGFWRPSPDGWRLTGMFGDMPLPLSWPVYVSHAEASAYARFVGKALPTEAQWVRAAEGAVTAEAPTTGNFDFRRWDPIAVDAPSQPLSVHGVLGQFGNGWEWTADAFGPFDGFEPFPFYKGYSANFFDGQHFVLKGAASRTAACMVRPSFRNWFQPHYQNVYAGFRCVEAA
ncbi:SUMF1/EgtB/PvdO family nonheme iron enzyme [Chitinasiproducens palmae]|uniref:Ergothioneine biosynthesis protein EgtB n=1 Tax=Chitinasiproducens palmae TaxID=1770053 RepID=A0A1H2PSH3_9BURK|nr:SUMF1/EgtB/PvdO family nonheme iron enzyme [Chitinasiproducens palmae]SDV49970.1 ergothioneine biosynthesis protein EgtB [Chitinasiproducens palmae]